MIRLTGVLCIVLSALGVYAVGERQRKREFAFLEDTLLALRRTESDVRAYHAGLLEEFSGFRENDFFARLLALQAEEPERELFCTFSEAAKDCPTEERGILERLGGSLTGDEEGLLSALKTAENEWSELISARRQKAGEQRRIRGATVFSGAALLLLVLL